MTEDYLAELDRRLDEAVARQDALLASIRPRLDALEPVVREQGQKRAVEALEAQGKVVRDKKPARTSGTVGASVAGAVAAVYAAVELFPAAAASGEYDAFGAAAGAAVTALVAIYRRWKVGDLEVWK